MDRLARLVGKSSYRQFSLLPLAVLEDIDRAAVVAAG